MAEEHFLVTGGLGRIGAWVVRRLAQEGVATSIFDVDNDRHRLELIMSPDELVRVQNIQGDITDLAALERALYTTGATHVIHLAALRMSLSNAQPVRGAQVNVVGTVNVFEAMRRAGLRHVVYASDVAAYGTKDDYPERQVPHDAPLKPHTHFGVYKQANEGTAHNYWLHSGISSIGLRPYIIYGPGCDDQDITSEPTRAMLAAAMGKAYHLSFGGKFDMEFADDVAVIFIKAARAPFEGAECFNLPGNVVCMREVIAAIEEVAPDIEGQLSFDDLALPFPEEVDWLPLTRVIGPPPRTSLLDGTELTIDIFKQNLANGRLKEHVYGS
jgi:nucleoside-diphosphate-sugar epimerase